MSMIWATRGRTWGFRFLRNGGLADPLRVYERMFPAAAQDSVPLRREGGKVALRLADPEGRCDRSGRIIVHEFILDGELANRIDSADDGLHLVWPLVSDEFGDVWELPVPPEPV